MRKIVTMAALSITVFFIAAVSLFAQHEASPDRPSKEQPTQRERLSKEAGVVRISTRSAGPVPTVVPNPEYPRYKLPSYDFVPKRMRTTEQREI